MSITKGMEHKYKCFMFKYHNKYSTLNILYTFAYYMFCTVNYLINA